MSAHICVAQVKIQGRVISADNGQPLAGASVKMKGTAVGVNTDATGQFILFLPQSNSVLTISFLGYIPQEHVVDDVKPAVILIKLKREETILSEVTVSTGYQDIPAERATGSFIKVDNELLNRKVGTDIISRLEDVVPGLIFNRAGGFANPISIRGQSTINANTAPLIVLDNFPYEGDINDINPNDVESISILKDAAAASIWGARAGNGVIVINTKKGRYNQPVRLSFNSNMTIGEKPDLFYRPIMSSADYIETEKALFKRGYYNNRENSASKLALSPVVELLIAQRDGKMSAAEADQAIEALKVNDVRRDYEQYLYRNSVNLQHSLSLSGGSENHRYFYSAGMDRNNTSLVSNNYRRITLHAGNSFSLLRQKLQLNTGLWFTDANTNQNNAGSNILIGTEALYPYARLVDDDQRPVDLNRYNRSFLTLAEQQGLLNWRYNPISDMNAVSNRDHTAGNRLSADLRYQLLPQLSVNVIYQYNRNVLDGQNLQGANSYYTRNLINQLTIVNADGSLVRPVPLGGILDHTQQVAVGHNARGQATFSNKWKQHELSAIGGYEIGQQTIDNKRYRLYGYDEEHATSKIVDYVSRYKSYIIPTSVNNIIPNNDAVKSLTDRFISWYGNAAYTWKNRYTVSASGRMDRSNLFGVRSNQKGVPLWSAGIGWTVNEEPFYNMSLVPSLKLRLTYGYNGNIDKSVSAYTTASYNPGTGNINNSNTRLPYATVVNPPNPELRWERVRVLNAALDFATKNNRLSGTVEYYLKHGIDLIGDIPYAPSNGITTFRGNTASSKSRGLDVSLASLNTVGRFKWTTNAWFSYIRERVTDYAVKNSVNNYIQFGVNGNYALEGKPLYAVYAYPWAGLDPQTGDPLGYVNGSVSKDYAVIRNSITLDEIPFIGSSRPVYYGALRNTFTMGPLSVSANISYRLCYYFRRASISYGSNSGLGGHGDYALRWQKPGDELVTRVPSAPAASNSNRDAFYTYSAALVEKGDHVRLQDLNISYDLPAGRLSSRLHNVRLYLYANNLGLLWRANNSGLDPDFQTVPPIKTIAGGLKIDF